MAYEAEGLTPEERAKSIIEQFRAMPRVAQNETLLDLLHIVSHLPDLYTMAVAARNEAEERRERPLALRFGAEKSA